MTRFRLPNGTFKNVAPEHLDIFKERYPNAVEVSDFTAVSVLPNRSDSEELGNLQGIKNSFYNAAEQSKDVIEFWFGKPGQEGQGAQEGLDLAVGIIYESVFGKKAMDEFAAKYPGQLSKGVGEEEIIQSVAAFKEEMADTRPTLSISEAWKERDIGKGLSAVMGAVLNVGGSVVYNIGTLGTGFFFDFAARNFIEANEAKAANENRTLEELIRSGDTDKGAPIRIAAFQAALEYIGFSKIMKSVKGTGVSKAYNNAVGKFLTKKYKNSKNIRIGLDMLSVGRTEAITEMGQTGLEIYNKELATAKSKGEDINELMSITKGMLSPEGIEAGLQGFFGGAGLRGGMYSAKALSNIRKTDKQLDVEEDFNKLVELRKRYNGAKDEDVKSSLEKQILKVESTIEGKIKKGNDIYNSLPNNDIKTIENLTDLADVAAFRMSSLIEKFREGKIHESEFTAALSGLNEEYKKNKQAIKDLLYQKNIEFAKKEGTEIGKKVVEVEDKNDFQRIYNEKRTEADPDIDVTGMDGMILGDEIYINKTVAKEAGAISVGSHELLHGVIGNSFSKLDDEVRVKLGKSFINTLTKEQEAAVRKRLKDSYGLEGDAIFGTEEMFTAFSDAIVKNEISFNENIFKRIGLAIEEVLRKLSEAGHIGKDSFLYRKEFSNGRQVYNFLKEYQANIEKGKLSERVKKFAETDREAGDVKFAPSITNPRAQQFLDAEIDNKSLVDIINSPQSTQEDRFAAAEAVVEKNWPVISNALKFNPTGNIPIQAVKEAINEQILGIFPQVTLQDGTKISRKTPLFDTYNKETEVTTFLSATLKPRQAEIFARG